MSTSTLVIGTGTANTASVLAGLQRVGAAPELTRDPQSVREAARVVLPGVGTYAAVRATLDSEGASGDSLAAAVSDRIREGRPTLCICLGLQLLFEGSEESPEVRGLGLIPGYASRFLGTDRVPQLGWNAVEAAADCEILASGYAYYANSYRLDARAPGWQLATTDHGGTFLAACERGPVVACQFHPELSGDFGMGILERWMAAAREQEVKPC